MNRDLENKTAIITGSGKKSGIGYAIVKELAKRGCSIVVADLGSKQDKDNLVSTGSTDDMMDIAVSIKEEFKVETLACALNVTDNASINQAVKTIKERFERIDILCNNAGASFGVPNAFHAYDEGAWMRTIDVNLHSVFKVTRGILPIMTRNGGCIINTASRAGKVPPLLNGAYGVAKAGVIMLTKIMALELAGEGIRVNAVCPGQIITDLEKWRFGLEAEFFGQTVEDRENEMCKTIPLNRIGEPAEVGKLVAFLASNESSYWTGQAINVTGGQLMEL